MGQLLVKASKARFLTEVALVCQSPHGAFQSLTGQRGHCDSGIAGTEPYPHFYPFTAKLSRKERYL